METFNIGKVVAIIENTGKTPAVQTTIESVFSRRTGKDPIPDYDSIAREQKLPEIPSNIPPNIAAEMAQTSELLKRFRGPSPMVLPPNSPREYPFIQNFHTTRDTVARIENKVIVYAVGKIRYHGTEGNTEYTTTFCLMNEGGTDFRFCPTGNDMK
jgi:hypothetical protein